MIAPTCFGPSGPSSGSLCRTLLKLQFCGISHKCLLHGTQYTPQLETLFTNIAEHLTTYFYWISPL